MGWAPQQAREGAKRFPEETRRYLTTKFDFGEVIGSKLSRYTASLAGYEMWERRERNAAFPKRTVVK